MIKDKAYITGREGKNHVVQISGKKIILDDMSAKNFLNGISTNCYLNAFKRTLPDGTKFNLIKLGEDNTGAYVNFETTSPEIIKALDGLNPKINFNVFGIGNLYVSYGKFWNMMLGRRWSRFIFANTVTKFLQLHKFLSQKRVISLLMTYNV